MKNLVEPIRDPSDIKRIIDYLEDFDTKYAVIFQLGIYSGLRISDILGLSISDVENKEFIEVLEKKTGKYKKFPLNGNLQNVIREYLKKRETQWSVDEFNPLFIGKKHCRLDKTMVYRVIVKACHTLHIDGNFGTHTMRKTFGYHHYKKFKDVALLQKIFNHSNPAITLRYIGIEQEEIDDSYKNFDYDFEKQNERNKQNYERTNGKFRDIQNSLDYLFNLYKKIDKKLDKISNKPINHYENDNILNKINNYLNNGGIKHRDFCLMLLKKD